VHPKTKAKFKNIYYRRPKWYNIIYDATNEKSGQLLTGYSVIPAELKDEIPIFGTESIKPKG